MDTARKELHELVDQLSDDQVPGVVSELRARLALVPDGRGWPPAWVGIAEGSSDDLSERVEEVLAEELGRRPA